jgi:hypothetical protein
MDYRFTHKEQTMSEQSTITLQRAQVGQMTGRELAKAIGIVDTRQGYYDTWRNNDPRSFQMEGHTWHAYTTRGRGKRSGTTYLHLYRTYQARVVDPDGNDTGMRVDDVIHYRGKAQDKVGTYRAID